METEKMADFIGVTDQQMKILLSLYKLQSRGEKTNPKSILREYEKMYGKSIYTSNFFTQTKQLQDLGVIEKTKKAIYLINFDNMKKSIAERKERFLKDLDEFDRLSEHVTDYFRSAALPPVKPTVEYLDYDQLYGNISRKLKVVDRFYNVTDFPLVAYTYTLAEGIGRGAYAEVIWDRCFKKKKLDVSCLTTLDMDFSFNLAFRVYADPKLAYKECKIVLEQLGNQVEKYENLHVKYLKEPQGMDVLIPERKKDEPYEFYLFTRDEHKNIQGGIHINSPETAASAKQMFLRDFKYAEEIKGKKGREILSNARKQLDEKYGVVEG